MDAATDEDAVRTTYDTVAVDYARLVPGLDAETALDRAMLATFAARVRELGLGPVADVGCGPGRMTAHLRSLGVDAVGIDLSPAMVDASWLSAAICWSASTPATSGAP